MSSIIKALKEGDLTQACQLIAQSSKEDISQCDHFGQTPLHLCVQLGYLFLTKTLLMKGADVNAIARDPYHCQMTPLHYAALFGDLESTRLLIQWGADLNRENGTHKTPASLAYQNGYIEVAQLIEKQFKPPLPKYPLFRRPSDKPILHPKHMGKENKLIHLNQVKRKKNRSLFAIASKQRASSCSNVIHFEKRTKK